MNRIIPQSRYKKAPKTGAFFENINLSILETIRWRLA
jgi:hypothetical protein